MIKVGDSVKLLSDDCACDMCDKARESFHTVVAIEGDTIRLDLGRFRLNFELEWEWEVEPTALENE